MKLGRSHRNRNIDNQLGAILACDICTFSLRFRPFLIRSQSIQSATGARNEKSNLQSVSLSSCFRVKPSSCRFLPRKTTTRAMAFRSGTAWASTMIKGTTICRHPWFNIAHSILTLTSLGIWIITIYQIWMKGSCLHKILSKTRGKEETNLITLSSIPSRLLKINREWWIWLRVNSSRDWTLLCMTKLSTMVAR